MSYDEFVSKLDMHPTLKSWYRYAGVLDMILANLYIDYLNEIATQVL